MLNTCRIQQLCCLPSGSKLDYNEVVGGGYPVFQFLRHVLKQQIRDFLLTINRYLINSVTSSINLSQKKKTFHAIRFSPEKVQNYIGNTLSLNINACRGVQNKQNTRIYCPMTLKIFNKTSQQNLTRRSLELIYKYISKVNTTSTL